MSPQFFQPNQRARDRYLPILPTTSTNSKRKTTRSVFVLSARAVAGTPNATLNQVGRDSFVENVQNFAYDNIPDEEVALTGSEGCVDSFVCIKYHRAKARHSREEVTKAIERQKEKNPNALITINDIASITTQVGDDPSTEEEDEPAAQWTKEGYNDDSDLAFIVTSNLGDMERTLSIAAFMPERTYRNGRSAMMQAMHLELSKAFTTPLIGIPIVTSANRSSIISIAQYNAYFHDVSLKYIKRRTAGQSGKDIDG